MSQENKEKPRRSSWPGAIIISIVTMSIAWALVSDDPGMTTPTMGFEACVTLCSGAGVAEAEISRDKMRCLCRKSTGSAAQPRDVPLAGGPG